MRRRHLVLAVVAAHVGVILTVALIGGCAKEKRKDSFTTTTAYEKIRAPEGRPESILEPEGLVEETELLVSREPEMIPVREERSQKPPEEMMVVERGPEKPMRSLIPEIKPPREELPSPPSKKTHRVAPGESLWKISHAYGITVVDLAKANELDPDKVLRIGQLLVIPEPSAPLRVVKLEEEAETREAPPQAGKREEALPQEAEKMLPAAGGAEPVVKEEVPRAPGKPRKHVVKKGESLWSISRKYGVPLEKIIDLNDIEEPSKIKAGQVILIPSPSPESGERENI